MMNGQFNKKTFLMTNIYNFFYKIFNEPSQLNSVLMNIELVLQQISNKEKAILHFYRLLENSDIKIIKELLISRQFLFLILQLFALSDWIAQSIIVEPKIISWLIEKWKKGFISNKEDLKEELARYIIINKDKKLSDTLKFFKKRELIRVAALDFIIHSDFNECVNQLSLLADVIIDAVYFNLLNDFIEKYGLPQYYDEQRNLCSATMSILALGKLGSNELNYHSDIDLLFIYSAEGETAGGEFGKISNKEFFTKIAQSIISLLSAEKENSETIYRVDIDLRPNGKSGELIVSLPHCLYYYKHWASTWEKIALLRLRHICGDETLSNFFISKIQSFLMSSANDIRIFKDIYEIKQKINKELIKENKFESDLKLGKGGIREIEFIVHSLFLYHFNELYTFHSSNTLKLIHMLASKGYLTIEEEEILSEAYKILRNCEHYIQIASGRQAHALPSSYSSIKEMLNNLSLSLDKLEEIKIKVNSSFEKIFLQHLQRKIDENLNMEELLFTSFPSSCNQLQALNHFKIKNPEFFLQDFSSFIKRIYSLPLKYFSNPDFRNMLIDAFINLTKEKNAKRGLKNFDLFLYSIKEKSEILNFLLSNKNLLQTLNKIFCSNEIISLFLRSNPNLLVQIQSLDKLKCPSKKDYNEEIKNLIDYARLKKQIELSKIALMEIENLYNRKTIQFLISQFVRDLIKEIMNELLKILPEDKRNSLITFSLGRLSLNEFNYQSDADLIWIYEPAAEFSASQQYEYNKIIQDFIRIFTLITAEGYLYKIDCQIRPGGKEGELVISSKYFIQYIKKEASPWELLSLLKLSYICGDAIVAKNLVESTKEIIWERLSNVNLSEEIQNLIKKFDRQYHKDNIKYGAGSLMDINLFLQFYLIKDKMAFSIENGTPALLNELKEKGKITKEEYKEIFNLWDKLEMIIHNIRTNNQDINLDQPIEDLITWVPELSHINLDELNYLRNKMRERLIQLGNN